MVDQEFDFRGAVRQQWDALARVYQTYRSTGDSFNDLIEIPAMHSLLGDVKDLRVLDAGCGTGELACYCAAAGANVTGVDIAEEMITEARDRATRRNLDIRFLTGDIENLPDLQSGQFDLVIVSVAIAGRLYEIVAESRRLLRNGGALCISDVHPIVNCGQNESRDGKPGIFVHDYFERSLRKTVNPFGQSCGQEDVEFIWQYYTLGDYFDALWKNGFVVERYLEPEPMAEGMPKKLERAKSYPIFFLVRSRKEGRLDES